MKKLLMLVLVLCLCVCLAACGDDDDDDDNDRRKKNDKKTEADTPTPEEDPTPTEAAGLTIASTEEWGDFTVGIPAEWTFRKGDVFDENDTRYCSVKKSDFKYFDFKREDESLAKQHYDYNKNTYTNEQVDVSGTYGDIAWTGFQYSDGFGGYGFELIATVNDKPVRVSSAGFKFDSEEAKTILGSLIVK